MNLNNIKKGDKVKYVGNNDYQKGVHTVLKVENNSVILDSFYTNSKYFIINQYNLNSLEEVKNE